MSDRSTRRDVLTGAGGGALAGGFASALAMPTTRATAQTNPAEGPATRPSSGPATRPEAEPFGYCLNASTINWAGGPGGNGVGQFESAARAGLGAGGRGGRGLGAAGEKGGAVPDPEAYEKKGGSVPDLAKGVRDLGLVIPSPVGFAHWIVDDDADRAKGLEQMRRDMDLVARAGGQRIAAPPIGANDANSPNL